jgi:hypothetical protein
MVDDGDAMVKDMVLAATSPPVTATPLDKLQQLLAEDYECASNLKFWAERRKVIQDAIKQALGDNEVGTVNGRPVVSYTYQDRFNASAFKKQYPNMYEVYCRDVTERRFDPELLKAKRPDLYHEFQVRAFNNKYEPPGESAK